MALIVPNSAEDIFLQYITNKVTPESLRLKLFTNNRTPLEDDDETDYIEASGNGYVAVTLTPASWTIVQGDPTEASYPEVTFLFTGALGNVYGYYVVGGTSGKLMWVENFSSGPFNIQNNGDQINVTVKMRLS